MRLIAGMHRSGTSMVARLFHEVGADLGNPATFYPADRWNPDGYFEQPEIHAINMPLINGRWGRLAYLRLPSRATIARRAEQMSAAIRTADEHYAGKIVKENRFCLTLEGWKLQGARFDRILVAIRDPIGVALSLRRRNRIPLNLGYRLWIEHNIRILDSIERFAIPAMPLYAPDLLDPSRAFSVLSGCFRFMSEERTESAIAAAITRVVEPAKASGRTHVSQPKYPPAVQQLWERLMKWCAEPEPGSGSLARQGGVLRDRW